MFFAHHFAHLILFSSNYIKRSVTGSPFGFIDFIFSYKTCIMKYTFRYSVVHGVQFYKMYLKKI